MTTMTPKERVKAFFRREPIDEMPCFSGMGTVTVQAIDKMGIRFAQVHGSAEYLAGSAITTAEMFGFDGVVVPYDMCTVPEALGRGASLYEDADGILYPTVPSKWATLDEVGMPEEMSVIFERGRMPVVDEAIGIVKAHNGGELAVGGWVLGPFTMAGQLIELDVLLKGLRKDKERVKAFLSKMTELVISVARHYQDLGVDYMNIREMGTGTDLLSPRMWKTIIKPNLEKVFSAIKSPKINHICGSTDLIIEMMNDCGADAVSVDQKNNVVESRKKLGDDAIILGNFDPYGTLTQMDPSQVGAVINGCVDDGVDAVWPGCDIWPDVKMENMEAYIQAVRDNGKTATPAVGRL
ncbi:MAG: methyltransferase [Deltaproteobacteria bacterium]|nr:methyltransferase [Deltaproteobacteria bacterium]MBW2112204.1 methyltransferase [Deltaproteobacteria bacterium]MBW2354292.1 methyltransferase [Deltaproteobacteria bacterium]